MTDGFVLQAPDYYCGTVRLVAVFLLVYTLFCFGLCFPGPQTCARDMADVVVIVCMIARKMRLPHRLLPTSKLPMPPRESSQWKRRNTVNVFSLSLQANQPHQSTFERASAYLSNTTTTTTSWPVEGRKGLTEWRSSSRVCANGSTTFKGEMLALLCDWRKCLGVGNQRLSSVSDSVHQSRPITPLAHLWAFQ